MIYTLLFVLLVLLVTGGLVAWGLWKLAKWAWKLVDQPSTTSTETATGAETHTDTPTGGDHAHEKKPWGFWKKLAFIAFVLWFLWGLAYGIAALVIELGKNQERIVKEQSPTAHRWEIWTAKASQGDPERTMQGDAEMLSWGESSGGSLTAFSVVYLDIEGRCTITWEAYNGFGTCKISGHHTLTVEVKRDSDRNKIRGVIKSPGDEDLFFVLKPKGLKPTGWALGN